MGDVTDKYYERIRKVLEPYMDDFDCARINDYISDIFNEHGKNMVFDVVRFFLEDPDCGILDDLDEESMHHIDDEAIANWRCNSIVNYNVKYSFPRVECNTLDELIIPNYEGKPNHYMGPYHALIHQTNHVLKKIDIRSMKFYLADDMRPILPVYPECINSTTKIIVKEGKAIALKRALLYTLTKILNTHTVEEANAFINTLDITEV